MPKEIKILSFIILSILVFACNKQKLDSVIVVPDPADSEIPVINIITENVKAINSKTNYVPAQLTISGIKKYKDLKEPIKIKGRGNFSWSLPKKPYHLEFEKTQDLFDFGADKDYLLIANYLDFNHILNATGFKMAELLEMPYAVKFKPVEVYLNNSFQGLYLLTQQIEKETNRVGIDDGGALIEFDTYYNDTYKFKSGNLALPINIKYPKIVDDARLNKLKTEFNALENSVVSTAFPATNFTDLIDLDSFCSYMIVSYLSNNGELNHPKSVFMHKNEKGKFHLGPVWDFDWAFSFKYNESYFNSPNGDLFWSSSSQGNKFFGKILSSPAARTKFKAKWLDFRANKFDNLLVFIDDYSKLVSKSRNSDLLKWNLNIRDYPTEINKMKEWLNLKAKFIDNMVSKW